jgi:Rieske Fe-S protein
VDCKTATHDALRQLLDRREVLKSIARATGCIVLSSQMTACIGKSGTSGVGVSPAEFDANATDSGAGQDAAATTDVASATDSSSDGLKATDTALATDTGTALPDVPPPPGAPFHIGAKDYAALFNVGGAVGVAIGGKLLVLIRVSTNEIRALDRTCTHAQCDMNIADGKAGKWLPKQQQLVCLCHGSRFANDGSVLKGPATKPLPSFPVTFKPETGQGWVDV